jgi:hypothetical protein
MVCSKQKAAFGFPGAVFCFSSFEIRTHQAPRYIALLQVSGNPSERGCSFPLRGKAGTGVGRKAALLSTIPAPTLPLKGRESSAWWHAHPDVVMARTHSKFKKIQYFGDEYAISLGSGYHLRGNMFGPGAGFQEAI